MEPVQAQEQINEGNTAVRRSAEFELLLACCRTEQLSPEQIKKLSTRVEWNRVLELAEQHGLLPVMQQRLAPYSSYVPIWQDFLKAAQLNARRALWLSALLEQVLDRLQAHSIEPLPYKGPALAEMLYGDIGLRQYTDLDVLIRPGDLPRAKAALGELGLAPHIQLTAAQERAYIASGYEMTFDGFGNRNLVELQWGILPRFYAVDFDMDRMFARAQAARVAGREVRSLAPDDLFLVLCVHAAKHLWARLAWIYDIARLGTSASINWSDVEKVAKQLGVVRIMGISLRLCHDLFGMRVPDVLQRAADDNAAVELAQEIVAQLENAYQPDTESVAYFRQWMRLRERARDRRRFVLRLATTPSTGEWDAVRLPGSLFPLYGLLRVFRLIRRFTFPP